MTVAAYGPSAAEIFGPTFFEGPRFFNEGEGVPWDARRKVTLTVAPTETLAVVIDRAAEEFGLSVARPGIRWHPDQPVSETIAGVAFYKPGDDLPYASPHPWMSIFPAVDEDGELYWKWISEAKLGDLLRAYERGLLPGDPQRIYLWPIVPQGGEVAFGTWPYLIDALAVFKDVAAVLAEAAGVVSFFEYLTAWRRRQDTASKVPTEALEDHNAGPVQVKEVVIPGRITLAQLQQFFGLEEEEAVALVALVGFDISEDGGVVLTDDPDAHFQQRLLRTLLDASTSDFPPDPERLREFARARLQALAEGKEEPITVWREEWDAVTSLVVPEEPSASAEVPTRL